MRTNSTNRTAFERTQRVSEILTKRLTGMSLAQIGAEQNPPVSAPAIHARIRRALDQIPKQAVDEIRLIEAHRLDQLLNAVWANAMKGDLAAVVAVLKITARRARLLGLDLQPGGVLRFGDHGMEELDPPGLKVEIINNPETERMRWLEEERERLLEGRKVDDEPSGRMN
jgi:hypothetical protein